ncbi:MAG: hypothetical protein H8D37_01170 [Chloroflexi bacterium]|nr:hypothetical protein [Chloroflexota bacterium]
MNKKSNYWAFVLLLGLVWLTPACAIVPEEVDADVTLTPTVSPAEADLPPEIAQVGEVRQWAISAEASTSYADPEWAAEQATGEPDTDRCGDYQSAWASSGSDSVDWLELQFETPVYVSAVNIVQTFNANQVAKVELLGTFGRSLTIYEQTPVQVDQPCPYMLSIMVEKTPALYNAVRITVDQSVLGLGWNEIDAVQLVGDGE